MTHVGPATIQNLVVKFDGEICGGVSVENDSDDFLQQKKLENLLPNFAGSSPPISPKTSPTSLWKSLALTHASYRRGDLSLRSPMRYGCGISSPEPPHEKSRRARTSRQHGKQTNTYAGHECNRWSSRSRPLKSHCKRPQVRSRPSKPNQRAGQNESS